MRVRIAGGRLLRMSDKLVERDGVIGVVLDPEEEAELVEQLAGLEEEERQGLLRPASEMFDELRAKLRQRRAG
jgi:hypothetical protein